VRSRTRFHHQGSRTCLAGSSTRQAGGGADTAGRRRPAGLAVWRRRVGAQRKHQRARLDAHRHPHTRAQGSKGDHRIHVRCTSGNAEDPLVERWPTASALLRSTLHRLPRCSCPGYHMHHQTKCKGHMQWSPTAPHCCRCWCGGGCMQCGARASLPFWLCVRAAPGRRCRPSCLLTTKPSAK
jgi:hypothetical protein